MKLFHFIHRWKLAHIIDRTVYEECQVCHKRKVTQYFKGYQPIDKEWLEGKINVFLDFYTNIKLKRWQEKNLEIVI